MEAVCPSSARTSSFGERGSPMAQTMSMAGGHTQHRDRLVVRSPGFCEPGAEGTEGTSNVQVNEEAAVRRRGRTRGVTQSLKRGIVSMQERLKPLRAAQGWLYAWLMMEIFSGMSELTVQAAGAGWQSLQPIELMCGDDPDLLVVSQLPYHKSTSLDANDTEFNEFLGKFDKPCRCTEHETIQGTIRVCGRTVKRSAAASRWMPLCCRYILGRPRNS